MYQLPTLTQDRFTDLVKAARLSGFEIKVCLIKLLSFRAYVWVASFHTRFLLCHIQTHTSHALAASLNAARIPDFPYFNKLIRILATRYSALEAHSLCDPRDMLALFMYASLFIYLFLCASKAYLSKSVTMLAGACSRPCTFARANLQRVNFGEFLYKRDYMIDFNTCLFAYFCLPCGL